MPKKKSKKGGVKTEEERLMLLQQRAQEEEEAARRKEETLTLFLKDKLQKEQKNSALNLLKLNEGWRAILRQNREAELRTDVVVHRQTFERQLDDKNSVVKKLVREVQESERQASHVQRAHLQHLERLQELQYKELTSQQQQWEDGLEHLMSTFTSQRDYLQSVSDEHRLKLEDLLGSTEQSSKDKMSGIHKLYGDNLLWLECAHEDEMATLNCWSMSRSIASQLPCTWEVAKSKTMFIRKQNTMRHYSRTARRLMMMLWHLRAKMNAKEWDVEPGPDDLRAARDEAARKCRECYDWLRRARRAAKDQLTELCVQGHGASKRLEAVISKEETFIRLAEICEKLELLFPSSASLTSSLPEEEYTERMTFRLCTALERREVLRRQRDALSDENKQLLFLLHQQEQDAIMEGHTTTLDVSQAPTTNQLSSTDKHYNVIEAALAVKHTL